MRFDLVDDGDGGQAWGGEKGGEVLEGEVGEADGAYLGGVGGEETLHGEVGLGEGGRFAWGDDFVCMIWRVGLRCVPV